VVVVLVLLWVIPGVVLGLGWWLVLGSGLLVFGLVLVELVHGPGLLFALLGQQRLLLASGGCNPATAL
jgi:hypothetical protein